MEGSEYGRLIGLPKPEMKYNHNQFRADFGGATGLSVIRTANSLLVACNFLFLGFKFPVPLSRESLHKPQFLLWNSARSAA